MRAPIATRMHTNKTTKNTAGNGELGVGHERVEVHLIGHAMNPSSITYVSIVLVNVVLIKAPMDY